MYNLDKNKLLRLIENASFSDDNEKNRQIREAFLPFFTELCNYTDEVNKSILNNTVKSSGNVFLPEIWVAIVDVGGISPNGKYEKNKIEPSLGLMPMAECPTLLACDPFAKRGTSAVKVHKRIFINDEYENLRQLLVDDVGNRRIFKGEYNSKGENKAFSYYLDFDRSFVEKQEILYRYALHYSLDNPVMYSPYSFKSFSVIALEENLPPDNLNYNFEAQGIKAIDNCDLFWNISLNMENNTTYTYNAKIPYGNENRYIFEFPKSKKGNYRLPLPCNNQVKIHSIDFLYDMVKITIDHDMADFLLLEPLELDKTAGQIKALKSNRLIFTNQISYNGIRAGRLVSQADIEHSIAPFRDNNGIKCQLSEGKGEIVKRYSKQFTPDKKDRKLFNIISREYIHFVPDSPMFFLTDYVNYVLEFLEYYYPEIEWGGEI